MATVNIKLNVDASGAVRSIDGVQGSLQGANVEMKGVATMGTQLNRIFEVAFGQILQRLLVGAIQKFREMAREFNQLSQDIQDIDGRFESTFRNIRGQADSFIAKFREMTGFTTTESRKIVAEIAEIALSLGETDENALKLAESSAALALQWEQISGKDFHEGYRLISLALTGNIAQLQRAGIISREYTQTQFNVMSMQERLEVVTQGLSARYGDLSQATDGLTQQHRQLNGRLGELRDQFVRALIPGISEFLEKINKATEDTAEFEVVIDLLASGFAELINIAGDVVAILSKTTEEGDELSKIAKGIVTTIQVLTRVIAVLLGLKVASWFTAAAVAIWAKIRAVNTLTISLRGLLRVLGPIGIALAAYELVASKLRRSIDDLSESTRLFERRLQRMSVEKVTGTISDLEEGIASLKDEMAVLNEINEEQIEAFIESQRQVGISEEHIQRLAQGMREARDAGEGMGRRYGEIVDSLDILQRRLELARQRQEELTQSQDDAPPSRFVEGLENVNQLLTEYKRKLDELSREDIDELFEIDIIPPDPRPIEDFMKLFREVGDTGIFSIDGINFALQELQDEMTATADPEQRAQLQAYIAELEKIRDAALGAQEGMEDFSIFLQTTMAQVLSSALIQFTNVFEEIGRGSANMAQAALRAIASIIRGIGQQLIAWGTAQLLMGPFGAPGGAAAIAYGMTLAAGGGLISGISQRGQSRGHGNVPASGGIGLQPPITGNVPATTLGNQNEGLQKSIDNLAGKLGKSIGAQGVMEDSNLEKSINNLASKLDRGVEVHGMIEGENIRLAMDKTERRRRAQGFRD